VISIVDEHMEVVCTYTYDAWGKVMAITSMTDDEQPDEEKVDIGAINPIRYRGYYYDTESGLYYLQSRYYDPETGRFINADDTDYLGASGTVLGYNLFAYCENNPVFYVDHTGYERVYSGIVGFGVQILFTVSMLAHQAFAGVEALWFTQTKNNNFGNGLMPGCYFFAGGGQGLLIDVSKVLSISFLNNPQKVLRAMGLGFSCSVSFSFF
jgi:RHS repeat-associated protein